MNTHCKDWQIAKMKNIIGERWGEVWRVVEARDTAFRDSRKYLLNLQRNIF